MYDVLITNKVHLIVVSCLLLHLFQHKVLLLIKINAATIKDSASLSLSARIKDDSYFSLTKTNT